MTRVTRVNRVTRESSDYEGEGLHLPDGRRVVAEQECVPGENTSGGRLNFILILFRLLPVHPV